MAGSTLSRAFADSVGAVQSRREFLCRTVGGGAAVGLFGLSGGLLVGCGDEGDARSSDSGSAADGEASFGTFVEQVSWIPGLDWAGSYMAAEAGVYEELGFQGGSKILYGGPAVAVEPVVQSGRALMGVGNSEKLAAAVRQGAELVVIGARLQRNPLCIASLPDNPINAPEDMVGKRIGIAPVVEPLWLALLDINGIDPSSTERVVTQHDPTPLVNGEIDGQMLFVYDQVVTIEVSHGIEPVVLMLADYGFALYQLIYMVTRDSLDNNRAAVTAGLKAESIGLQMLLADPEEAIRLTREKYATDQDIDPEYARLLLEGMEPLLVTPTTEEQGLLYMSDDDIAANLETLARLDLEVPADTYTREILDEIYADGTDLT